MSISHRSTRRTKLATAISRFNAYGVLTVPDGRCRFGSTSKQCTAEIQFACIGNRFIAEYRYQFLNGQCQGATLPLSDKSVPLPSLDMAVEDAARRLIIDVRAKCPNPDELPMVQQKQIVALVAWAESLISPPPQGPLAGKRFLDLFAGIGGFHQALKQQGATCVAACEIDKAARATYCRNHGTGFPFHKDIKTLMPDALPPFEILCAGFPCQSFSIAGKQKGYADPNKGALFFDVVRIIRECRPELVVLENVPQFATIDGGQAAATAMNALAEIGYATSMQVLNSAEFGVPQQRERLFMVAHRLDVFRPQENSFAFPEGTDPDRVVADILEPGVTTGCCDELLTDLPRSFRVNPREVNRIALLGGKESQGYRVYSPDGRGITLCAESGGRGAKTGLYAVDGKVRALTTRESARMQGFPEEFQPDANETQACKQFGNSVTVPVVAAVVGAAAKFI